MNRRNLRNVPRKSHWEELRTLLQLAALPVTGQMRLVTDDCCRLELLARALVVWHRGLPPELVATLTPEQERTLTELECRLARACREATSSRWTEPAMRQSEGVRAVRWLARAALVQFGWRLEVPPENIRLSWAHC